MNKKKILVAWEPPILPQLLMTPGLGHKGLLCLDDLRGSLPVLFPPEINMARINTDDMIKTFKDIVLEIKPLKLIPCDDFSFQVKFPRSKKKRIRKKWAKRPENYSDMMAPRRMIDQLTRCTEYVTKNILKEGFGFPCYKRFL
ncbi:hypothetical protein KAR91_52480 [Candidatus Pacearchaeota archaeon]|nr:hypothetical protein [Candidatus Pacearchaeota archaeon]